MINFITTDAHGITFLYSRCSHYLLFHIAYLASLRCEGKFCTGSLLLFTVIPNETN
jgi:hypothetical protein